MSFGILEWVTETARPTGMQPENAQVSITSGHPHSAKAGALAHSVRTQDRVWVGKAKPVAILCSEGAQAKSKRLPPPRGGSSSVSILLMSSRTQEAQRSMQNSVAGGSRDTATLCNKPPWDLFPRSKAHLLKRSPPRRGIGFPEHLAMMAFAAPEVRTAQICPTCADIMNFNLHIKGPYSGPSKDPA